MLFGIQKQSDYNFLHHYDVMEVGGIIEFLNGTREFRRVKRSANTLLDAHGQPIPDAAILVELDGLSRADYALKFSIDADKLRDGGKNILESRSDLGELLFAGSADVADLSHKLNAIRAEVDGFYREGTRAHEIKKIKDQIKALDDEKKKIDTLAAKYASYNAELRAATGDWNDALEKRTEASNRKAAIERLENGLPLHDAISDIDAALKPLTGVAQLPSDVVKIVKKFQREDIENDAELKAARKNIADWTEDLGKIALDQKALDVAETIDFADLATKRSRYVTADEDLQKREGERAATADEIAAILRAIGREGDENPKDLDLDARTIAAMRDLIGEKTRVDTQHEAAQSECDDALDDVDEKRADLKDIQNQTGVGALKAEVIKNLAATITDVSKGTFDTKTAQATRTLKRQRAALEEAMKPLAPWTGSADELPNLRVPDAAQIERWKTNLETALKAKNAVKDKIADLETERATLVAEKDAAETSGAVSDSEAEDTRRQRDNAWTIHRNSLQAESADTFHALMRADDQIGAGRLRHANDVARLNTTLAQIGVKTAAIKRQNQLLETVERNVADVRTEFAEAVKRVSDKFAAAMTPAEFALWANACRDAVSAQNDVTESLDDLNNALDERNDAHRQIAKALAACGGAAVADDDLETLIARGQQTLDAATALQNAETALKTAQKALDSAEKATSPRPINASLTGRRLGERP